jgi:hypothetical protein
MEFGLDAVWKALEILVKFLAVCVAYINARNACGDKRSRNR